MTTPLRSHGDWILRARSVPHAVRPLIDGRFVDSDSEIRHPNINPATEQALSEVSEGSPSDVERAAQSAMRAFREGRWSRTAPSVRRDVLMRLHDLFLEHREELALLDCLDVGKPITQALSEVDMACGYLRFAAEACEKIYDHIIPSHPDLLALNIREPIGVVGAILPWNFPMVVVALKIAPALATGNSVVLKPSELSPLSAGRIGELALQAGLPAGVLNIVPGAGPTVGTAISKHPLIEMLTFTGSTATGRALAQASANVALKKCLLECGGKSPHIVFADTADLDAVANDVVEQITWNQGQVCVAGSRLLVEASIEDALVERVVQRMAAIQPGDPLDPATTYGPLVSAGHLRKVMAYLESAPSSGARLRTGGHRFERRGYYVEPTVFDRVHPQQPIFREEVFGPVLSVISFETAEHAAALANNVDYGLSARIWTRDVGSAYALARALRAGDITINGAVPSAPGVGAASSTEPFAQSGFGVEGGLEGLRQYTRLKSIHINLPHL